MLILGVSSTIAFGLLHVRYFLLLGFLMGLFNIIPIAGGVITIILVAVVAALDSWTKMAGVLIFYLIYVNIENAYLIPRIMRSSVNLMGLTVLVALSARNRPRRRRRSPRRRPHRRPHHRPPGGVCRPERLPANPPVPAISRLVYQRFTHFGVM